MVELTVAIQVGVVMAAILFMHRMAGVVQVEKGVEFLQGDVDDAQIPALDYAFQTLPAGVEMYSLRGPLFFGAARSLRDALEARSEEHTSDIQSLMRSSYADFCLKKKNNNK